MEEITDQYGLYLKGRNYNNRLSPSYYPTVDKNYRFYSNNQWYGVKANGLPTPVFNILKQIVDYKISSVTSSKTKMQFGIENLADNSDDPAEQELQKECDMISGYSEVKWEKLKMDSLIREILLDGAVSGDMCFYTYWNKDIDSYSTNGVEPEQEQPQPIQPPTQDPQQEGQSNAPILNTDPAQEIPEPQMKTKKVKVMGDFVTEVVDGSNVMFGNPNNNKVQSQPYILIGGRDLIDNLKDKAKANGIGKDEIDKICSDLEIQDQAGDRGKIELDVANKCLYLIKLWKEKDHVFMEIVTKSATIQEKTDTGLKLYPIAWANWDLLKNSYHGQAEISGLIPNQILVNQMASNIAYHMRMTAFGKTIYDKTRITAWNNAIGSAIGVEGDVGNAVQQLLPGQMSNMIIEFFDKVVNLTKELVGANDSALGNVDPKNTSAIIAVQRQASVPLEGVKGRFYQLIEDLGLIWLDFIINKYQVERTISYKVNDVTKTGQFDGSKYKDVPFKLKIDVGASSYWSEIASMQTLDNLLTSQKITFLQYLERVPQGILSKKQELIDEIKAQKPPVATDKPSINIPFVNMPMAAQIQALGLAGIKVSPEDMQQVQQQQMQEQGQQMQQQTDQLNQAHQQLSFGQMKQFVETLAPQIQAELKKLPDAQYEQAVNQLMEVGKQGGFQPPQQGGQQNGQESSNQQGSQTNS